MSSLVGVTSSFCGDAGCVRVKLGDQTVSLGGGTFDPVTNTMTWPISDWEPFIQGVKAGEFDIVTDMTAINGVPAVAMN